eukprot:s514_g10.t1
MPRNWCNEGLACCAPRVGSGWQAGKGRLLDSWLCVVGSCAHDGGAAEEIGLSPSAVVSLDKQLGKG